MTVSLKVSDVEIYENINFGQTENYFFLILGCATRGGYCYHFYPTVLKARSVCYHSNKKNLISQVVMDKHLNNQLSLKKLTITIKRYF